MAARKNLDFTVNVDFVSKSSKELNNYIDKLTQLRNGAGNRLSGSFLDSTIAKLKEGQKELLNFNKTLNNGSLSKNDRFASIGPTAQSMKGLVDMMKTLNKTWLNQAIKNNDSVLKQLDEMIAKQKQLASIKGNMTKTRNTMDKAEQQLASLGYTGGTTKNDSSAIGRQIGGLNKTINANKEKGLFDNKDLEAEVKRLTDIKTQIDAIVKGRAKLVEYGKQSAGVTAIDGKSGLTNPELGSKRIGAKIDELTGISDTPETINDITKALSSMSAEVQGSTQSLQNFEVEGVHAFKAAQVEAEKTKQTTETLRQIFAQFGIGISAVQIVNYFKDMAQSAFEFYKSLDTGLNQIYVVSGLTADAVMNLKDNFIRMSKESGMAIDDITKSAVLFYQQGLNTDEVLEMTEVTAQFAKVAGIDATDAANKLTAAVNGYCMAAEDASIIADKFNKVAAASAADINELSTAFSKAAAQANQAGVSMDNYLAYIATMEEATREAPENIGTSLKTIFSRMQQIKKSGSSEDGETDVNQVETALKSVGVQLRNSENQLRNLEDVLDDLGKKWNQLDINTQAYLGTIIAGTRQQSRFITLMQNWDRVLDLSEQSEDSAGQQAIMHQKAMESLETAVQKMNNAWQTFLSNLTESDTFKNVINLVTSFLERINKGNAPVIVLSTAIAVLSRNLAKLTGPINNAWKGIKKFVNTLKTAKTKASSKSLMDLKKEVERTGKAYDAAKKETQKYSDAVLQCTAKNQKGITVLEGEGEAARKVYYTKEQLIQKTQQAAASEQLAANAYNASKEAMLAYAESSQQLLTAGTTLIGLLTTVLGLFDMLDTTLGGAAVGFAELAVGVIGLIPLVKAFWTAYTAGAAAGTAATVAFKTVLDSTGIGLLLTAIALAVTGLITLVKSITGAGEKAKQAMEDAVQNVGEALDAVNNAKTAIAATEKLLKKYEELSKKIYLTTQEQQELNDTIQQLGDTYDIEVLKDAYGNLSINIAEVNERLEEEKEKLKKLQEELDDAEKEGRKDNKFQLIEYYEKSFATNRSQYKKLMTGIEDTDLDPANLRASAQDIQAVSTNLKNAIMDDAEDIAVSLEKNGKKFKSVSEYIVQANDEINNSLDDTDWEEYYNALGRFKDQVNNMSYEDMQKRIDVFFEDFQKQSGLTTEQIELLRKALNSTLYGNSNLDNTINKLEDSIDKQKLLAKEQERIDEKYKKHWYDYVLDVGTLGIYGDIRDTVQMAEELESFTNIANMDTSSVEKLIDRLNKLTDSSAAAIDSIGGFDDILGENGEVLVDAEDFLSSLDLTAITEAFKIDERTGMNMLFEDLADIINNTDEGPLKEALQKKLDKVVSQMSLAGELKWEGLADTLDKASEHLRTMNDIMAEFKDEGAMTLDTFKDLCTVLDSIDLESVFQTGMMDEYLNALEQLNLGFDASTGMITAEGDALQALQTIQEAATKAEIQETINTLTAKKASLEAELAMVQAEMDTNTNLINHLKASTDAKLTLDEIKAQGDSQYTNANATAAEKISNQYANLTRDSATWSEATINNIAKIGDAMNALANNQLNSSNAKNYLNQLVRESTWSGYEGAGLDSLGYSKDQKLNSEQIGEVIAALESYNAKVANTADSIRSRIKTIDTQIGLLEKLKNSDLSKLGRDGADKGDDKKIEKYIGQLKEIYNILNRIQLLEHRLSTLDTYSDTSVGKQYADFLKERINLTEELTDQYDFLVREQKAFTNGARDAILDWEKTSGAGGVFDFDKYGQIIINFEKYNALQDEAVEGEKSLKEQADEWYETYTDMFDELQDDFDKYIEYLERAIDLQQEMLDAYVEMENKAADAVKEIYQKILDTKLDAIDREKEAIEELRAAREQDRKDQENAKAVSNLQTNLQRAMMDTSGASDIAFIKAQGDIEDKLEEIAEDKYSQMLDDIIDKLDKEQEVLQDEFDQLWDNMDWLFSWLDEKIMKDEDNLNELLMQTEEWNTSSAIQREQLLQEWDTNYQKYMAGLQGDKTIFDIWDNINLLRTKTVEMDEALKNNDTKIGQEIVAAIHSINVSSGGGGGGGGGGGSSSYSGGGGGGNVPSGGTTDNHTNNNTVNTRPESKYKVGDKLQSASGTLLRPWNKNSAGGFTQASALSTYVMTGKYKVKDKAYDKNRGLWFYLLDTWPDAWFSGLQLKYKNGGFAYDTGPAWLDGTQQHPEAVLNALQTEHFIKFTNTLDQLYGNGNPTTNNSSVNIENISFNVESMSSTEDGEKAFNMFVDKFKEIGNQTGIKINSFKNTL